MGFKCGIVGLPNVGKSTLFNALTASKNAEAGNFPFCTIDPNIGIVDVIDERLDHLSKLSKSKKYNTTLWISLPDQPGKLGDVTTMIGINNVNISSVEMVEKTKKTINFRFNLIIHDLKNFTKLISELKQKEYNFKIIRHKNKKYAFIKRLFGGFKKN